MVTTEPVKTKWPMPKTAIGTARNKEPSASSLFVSAVIASCCPITMRSPKHHNNSSGKIR